jgi:tetratricopeptide (TPR) repeat protein
MELGKTLEAISFFAELLKANPGDVVARFNLGNAYMDIELYDKAIEQYKVGG